MPGLRWPRRATSLFAVLLVLLAAGVGSSGTLAGSGVVPVGGDTEPGPGLVSDPRLAQASGPTVVMLELDTPPAVIAYGAALASGAASQDAERTGREQRSANELRQLLVLDALNNSGLRAQVLYRVRSAYNGVAVRADAGDLARLGRLPGVRAVHFLPALERENANTQPLIGAPQVWESFGLTGSNIRVGVIDTGVDYTHTMFGGSGDLSAYADSRLVANNPSVSGPLGVPANFAVVSNAAQVYPSAKVAGGFDFAGDGYNGSNTPQPDPNPQDCPSSLGGGHGTHVAGIAAGYGVNADGTTYAGPWDTTTPFDTMRIGPGVAPQATLYALRVFGCTGSTHLTTQALDWAVDPNGDGNPADHLDVVNISLGTTYGSADTPEAVAADNAALAGVVVVASAGNSSDVVGVTGSPGSATRALTVAASGDTVDRMDGFQVNTPPAYAGPKVATFSNTFTWASLSPVTGDLVYNVGGNTTGCTAFPANSLTGKIVLVDWAPAGTSNFPCGSAVRADNAQAAGAVGIIMASGQPTFDTGIAGNTTLPAVFTTNGVGTDLKAALGVGTTSITLTYALQGKVKYVRPGADDTLADFSSRGPRGRDDALKPDLSAPGLSIFSADVGSGNGGKSIGGTSQAAPHVAGMLALLRQEHPDWTVEQLKALAMNTANHDLWTGLNGTGDRYGPARVGSGRIDVPAAQASQIVAYNAETPGAVSVSFGAVEVPGTLQRDKTITVVNKGGAAATLTPSYDARTTIPGVTYTFPDGNTVSVPAGGEATFRVRLSADAAQMKNTHDPTLAATQASNPRHWLSEASGNIILTPASGPALRVPVYAAARPASQMTTSKTTLVAPGATGSLSPTLTGQGVSTGPEGPGEHNALVSMFELQGTSPQLNAPPIGRPPSVLNADLQYVGVTANPTNVYFAVTTWHDFGTPATDIEFDIYIDRDRNGTDDLVLFNTRATDADVFFTVLAVPPSFSGTSQGFTNVLGASTPSAAMNNNVLVLPVKISALGMAVGSTRFNYRIEATSRNNGTIDTAGPFTFDYANRGFDFGGVNGLPPVYFDRSGDSLPAAYNQANYLANNSLGMLLLHHYNVAGTRGQVLPVGAQIAVTAPATKAYGDAPFVVSATATTAQAVAFSAQTPQVCTVAAATVTIVGTGTCTIRAATTATPNFGATFADTSITITVGPASTLAVTDLPASVVAGDGHAITVTARDGVGNVATGYVGTVHFTSSDPLATLPADYTFVPGDNGTHTFGVTLRTPGARSVTATDTVTGGITGAATTTVSALPGASPSPSPSPLPSPSPSPAATVSLTLSTAGGGGGTATPAGTTTQAQGSSVTLTASPNAGSTFAGWSLDGTLVSWATSVTLTMNANHAVVATFQPLPTFTDVPAGQPFTDPVQQLAARGIINGCFTDPTTQAKDFCPGENTLRHQMAALIARAMPGWATETGLPTFGDNTDDAELMTRVATLQRHNVVRGYQADVCAERGIATPPGCYGPLDTVKYGQVMLFIARAMVEKGYWTLQADDRTVFPDQNGAPGAPADDQQTKDHRMVVTYVHYVVTVPDVANVHANFMLSNGQGWADAAPRAWFTRAFWPALQSYFGADNVP